MTSPQAHQRVNAFSYVTYREDDTNSIAKITNRWCFSFPFPFLFFFSLIGMMISLRNSVHDYSLCAITSCMIMPLLFPPVNLAVYSFLFLFFFFFFPVDI